MTALVKVEIKDHIAHVLLNRPDKYNALSPEMFRAINDAGESVSQDPSVRVIILSGAGRGFCAGLDFESFMAMGSGERNQDREMGQVFDKRSKDGLANYAQLTGYVWKKQEVPVIAAIHGVAYGGGLQIALGTDIRLAAPDARFSIMEIKWGLIPDMSITQTIRNLVSLDVAKELMFTGRIVEAPEAKELGLITRICDDPLKEAQNLAKEIANKSPDAITAGKQLLESAWNSSAGEGLKLEETLQRSLIGSENQMEAVKANFENREPNFKDHEPEKS
jgi:enoyl-CoA hydratase/carnithine racemase